MIILLVILMFFSGLLLFCMNYQHLLINLICVEFMMLSLFMFAYYYLLMMNFELYFSLVFLSFMVSEGVLGLSLLISMVRSFGNNYFQSFNLFKW